MFTESYLTDWLGLTVTYSIRDMLVPPGVPTMIEFLEAQSALFHGILYIAVSEEKAREMLSREDLVIYSDVIILVAEAGDTLPDFGIRPGRQRLHLYGIAENAIRIFNSCAINGRTRRDLGKPASFEAVWSEIASTPSLPDAEIATKLKAFPELGGQILYVGVVAFHAANVSIPYRRLVRILCELIPNCMAALYQNEIVLLAAADGDFTEPLRFDREQVSALIAPYDGCLALSNGTSVRADIRARYYLTQRTGYVVHAMGLTDRRVFSITDYQPYMLIDLANYAFSALLQEPANMIVMVHPAVTKLAIYDRQNEDNLLEVLYQYLVNDRNVALAAEPLFMHRNTVLRKVKKILSLLDLDLERRELRESVLISCVAMRYIKEFTHTPLRFHDIKK